MTNLTHAETDTTRQRILEAAEVVFAEKGFAGASVRDILRKAEVSNIAAINYYFGDKERLYIETVKAAHICCNSTIPFPDWAPGVPAEQKLREFIHVLIQRMFEPQRTTALQLMMREMAIPSPAGAEVVQEYVRPMAEKLAGIFAELLPNVPEGKRFLFGCSVVGQCLFYRTNRSVLLHLMGEEAFNRLEVDRLANHIADFTINGLGLSQSTAAVSTGGNEVLA